MRNLISKVLAAFVVCFGCLLPAAAEEKPDVELSQKGSITVAFGGDVSIEDISFEMYQIADLQLVNSQYTYVSTPDFSLTNLDTEKLEDPNYVGSLEAYITQHDVKPDYSAIAVTDQVVFSDLSLGIYLVRESNQEESPYIVPAYLVTVPGEDLEGNLVYDVTTIGKAVPTVNKNFADGQDKKEPSADSGKTTTPDSPALSESRTKKNPTMLGSQNTAVENVGLAVLALILIASCMVMLSLRRKHKV